MRRYTTSLFIFRRDLRIHDNNALNKALSISDRVLPCFIFDPRQIQPHSYQSKPALRFMMQSLADLKQSLQALGAELALYEAFPVEIIKKTFERHRIQAVFVNRDYTPFSRIRDSELAQVCNDLNIYFHVVPDYLLIEPEQAVKGNGEPYKVFTAFYNNARQLPVALPQALEKANFMKVDGESSLEQLAVQQTECLVNTPPGGRNQALTILGQLEQQKDYLATRDYPFQDATSKLSAHLKFGTCSIREAYYAITQHLGLDHPLLRQLYWRDFFTHIAFHYPHVFGKAFISRYNNLMWDNDKEYFEKWRDGKTGFPIVDAGMRELNSTGFMHNRVRMIVASFLTKDLHISWRWGERYFAQHLVDYDPSINNGNWQWAASTGCDAQPYFRIFNPWLQQQKFDPDCQYIYHWIPELKGISPSLIHNWHKKHSGNTYPAPMVDHALESRAAKARYKGLA